MKKELIFLGPPACGKGTQTNRLSEYLGFPHVDTGSLLRAEIAKESEEGKIAKSFIDKGQLVPAELVGKIIAKNLQVMTAKTDTFLTAIREVLNRQECLMKSMLILIRTMKFLLRLFILILIRKSLLKELSIENPALYAGKFTTKNLSLLKSQENAINAV